MKRTGKQPSFSIHNINLTSAELFPNDSSVFIHQVKQNGEEIQFEVVFCYASFSPDISIWLNRPTKTRDCCKLAYSNCCTKAVWLLLCELPLLTYAAICWTFLHNANKLIQRYIGYSEPSDSFNHCSKVILNTWPHRPVDSVSHCTSLDGHICPLVFICGNSHIIT